MSLSVARRIAGFTLLLAFSCGASAETGVAGDALAIDPASVSDASAARSVLDAVEQTRRRLSAERVAQQAECRRRVLVNGCLADLDEQRRGQESRLKALEVRARTLLREDRALQRHEDEAARLEGRRAEDGAHDSGGDSAAAAREARERRRSELEAAQAARGTERAAQAERRAERDRAREQERAARAEQARRRDAEAPRRAAEHAARVEQHEAELRERRARLLERAPAADGKPSR